MLLLRVGSRYVMRTADGWELIVWSWCLRLNYLLGVIELF